MAIKVGPKYKPASTNVRKNGTGGSFGNRGQKAGKKSLNRKEVARNRDAGVQAKLRKISKALFAKQANVSMHAQSNG